MTTVITTKRIIRLCGSDKLELVKCDGYFYFAYTDEEKEIFETESVYIYALNQMELVNWIEIGRDFVAKMQTK